ncbi:MAG TPA: CDP-diacylglycerol--serine O-phosphatidyltransferase [Gemmatimonadaceae bacterium]|nr:CDP-diacylglycerol--serine O-phosphatidyltransferase [Gemmatimonadaceae bacterium]
MATRIRRHHVRRAAPALPNGFTLGNLFCGVYAIILASRGDFSRAVLFVVIGGVADAFDGRVARATGTGSRFGEELDSLVDAISFGLAPAMIVYFSVLRTERLAPLAVFLFAAGAVLRLARFNVTQAGGSKSYFIGLPSPAAGGTLATYYWFSQTSFFNRSGIVDLPWQEIMLVLMGALGLLMISPVPYPVWPKVGFRSWQGALGLLLVLTIVFGIFFFSKFFFFAFGVGYVAFGLARWVLLHLMDRVPTGAPEVVDEEDEGTFEDEEDVALATPAEVSAGRRKRRRRRRTRPDVPTPLANQPILEEPRE